MKKKFIILIVLLSMVILTLPLTAGKPQTAAGSKSVFFGFNGLSNLSVEDSWIGFQYLFADKMGLWGSISLTMLTEKPSQATNDNIKNDFEFDVGFIYYLFEKGPVACWVSPSIGLGFGSTEFEEEDMPLTKISSNLFYAGVSIGAEWFFTDNVSISADTFLGFQQTGRTTEIQNFKTEYSKTEFGFITGAGASLVLLFYF